MATQNNLSLDLQTQGVAAHDQADAFDRLRSAALATAPGGRFAGQTEWDERYYTIAGLTLRVRSDLPITDTTFLPKFERFRLAAPGDDVVAFHHHFYIPDLSGQDTGPRVYQVPPWAVHHRPGVWTYIGISPDGGEDRPHRLALFDEGHNRGEVFFRSEEGFRYGRIESLTLLPSDQILLAQVLADRQAFLLHASGMAIDGHGLLFIGHSEAGKSTTVTMLRELGEILCDDRVVLRRWADGFRIHGTWSHGTVPEVSAAAAPLRAIFFLEKAPTNRLLPLSPVEVARQLPLFVIKPLVTARWWHKVLDVVGAVAREVPVYRLQLDKSGRVAEVIRDLLAG